MWWEWNWSKLRTLEVVGGPEKSSLWGPKRISNVWAVAVVATWDSSTGFTEFTNKSEQMGLQPAKKGILQHHKPDRILKLTSVDILGLQLMCWTITGTKISTQQMGKILRFQTAISVGSSDCLPMLPIEMAVWLDVSHWDGSNLSQRNSFSTPSHVKIYMVDAALLHLSPAMLDTCHLHPGPVAPWVITWENPWDLVVFMVISWNFIGKSMGWESLRIHFNGIY